MRREPGLTSCWEETCFLHTQHVRLPTVRANLRHPFHTFLSIDNCRTPCVLICQTSCNMVLTEQQPCDAVVNDRRIVNVMSMPCITGK